MPTISIQEDGTIKELDTSKYFTAITVKIAQEITEDEIKELVESIKKIKGVTECMINKYSTIAYEV